MVLVIGIAGGTGVGKSTVAKIVEKQLGQNVVTVSISDYLRRLYQNPEESPIPVEKKENPSTEDLVELGNKLRSAFCNGILVKMILDRYLTRGLNALIIEGIRTLGEASELLTYDPENTKTFLIYVTARKDIRLSRLSGPDARKKFETIYRLEKRVWKTYIIRKVADYVITNNGSIGGLNTEVVTAIEVMRKKFSTR